MNNQTHQINHQKIVELLTSGAGQLDESIVSSLHQARIAALKKQRTRAPAFSLSTITHHFHSMMIPHSTGQWLATAILLVSVAVGGTSFWQQAQAQRISHLDIAILTDDLPMEVFID